MRHARSHRRPLMVIIGGIAILAVLAPLVRFAIGDSGLLAVAPAASLAPIQLANLFADQSPDYMQPTEPGASDPVTLYLRGAHGNLSGAAIQYYDPTDAQFHTTPMRRDGQDRTGRFDDWRGTLPASPAIRFYRFRVSNGMRIAWYTAGGASLDSSAGPDFWIIPGFSTPAWSQSAIYYQIFPDRFFDGDPSNNLPVMSGPSSGPCPVGSYLYNGECAYTHARWSSLPDQPSMGADFFGGDLQGVIAKLDPYLKQTLGVTALYLNPIFQSPSNHKYDTQNYFLVDPHFGTNQTLVDLVRAAHATDHFAGDYRMSVILDGVFNHTSNWNAWFNEAGIYPSGGAYQSRRSPYYGYYAFPSWPANYCDWSGVSTLPKLNYSSTALQDVIWRSPASVMQTYLRAPYNIDGWRYDTLGDLTAISNVAACTGPGDSNAHIWQSVRKSVKAVNPNALMLGEIWTPPSAWLAGNEMDAVMNYNGFGMPVVEWLTGNDMLDNAAAVSPSGLDGWLHDSLAAVPRQAALSMMNSLDTHDTQRFLTLANGNARVMLEGVAFQMTYVGSPSIYYGDEIGMEGGADPDNRRTFDWNQRDWNRTILGAYQKLIALRKQLTALRSGSFITLDADDANNIYAFGRWDSHAGVITVLNNDGKPHVVTLAAWQLSLPDGARLRDALSGQQVTVRGGVVTLTLPAQGAMVLVGTPGA